MLFRSVSQSRYGLLLAMMSSELARIRELPIWTLRANRKLLEDVHDELTILKKVCEHGHDN